MSANIWIDTRHNNLHASDKLLLEVLEERREHAQKSVLEIPEKDVQKQKLREIEKLLTSQFTIGRVTFGNPKITRPEPEGGNYLICQTIPF